MMKFTDEDALYQHLKAKLLHSVWVDPRARRVPHEQTISATANVIGSPHIQHRSPMPPTSACGMR